jgi:hypothetical protein
MIAYPELKMVGRKLETGGRVVIDRFFANLPNDGNPLELDLAFSTLHVHLYVPFCCATNRLNVTGIWLQHAPKSDAKGCILV